MAGQVIEPRAANTGTDGGARACTTLPYAWRSSRAGGGSGAVGGGSGSNRRRSAGAIQCTFGFAPASRLCRATVLA